MYVVNEVLPNEPRASVLVTPTPKPKPCKNPGVLANGESKRRALISFCDKEERHYLKSIERLAKRTIQVNADHPFPFGSPVPKAEPGANDRPPRDPRDKRGGNGGGDRRPRKSNANTSNGGSSSGGNEGGNRNGGDRNKSRPSNKPKGKQKDLAFSFKKKGNRSK